MKILPITVSVVVVAAVIAGFFIVGSPMTQRARRFDERRVSDLQAIQWEVVNYWQMKAALPDTLDALRNDIRGFVPPTDPETGAAYEYTGYGSEGPVSFELCATFAMAGGDSMQGITRPMPEKGIEGGSWAHEAGRTCFTRRIDKDLYPPLGVKPAPVIQ